ncbi:hypothetical protein VE03_02383 [Pseudogymnoascus sp. 23342-1-I1]|nr:hypothetical protein VE03_02383 [Pseudogymnoascus sp. 23342-1-I1]
MPSTRPNTSLPTPIAPPPPESPTSQRPDPRPSLNILDLEAGCIVWLPSKDLHSDSSISSSSSSDGGDKALEEKGYNHPVVVLEISKYNSGDKICLVAIITSQNHNTRFDRLSISQEAPTSNNDGSSSTELYLENSAKMNKQSYIPLNHIFQLRASRLRSCSFRPDSRPTDTRLCEESHARLLSRLSLQRGAWVATSAAVREAGVPGPSPSPGSRTATAEGSRRGRRSRAARGEGRRYAGANAAGTRRQSLPQPRTPQRMPGAWDDAEMRVGGGGGRRGRGYGSVWGQGERWESEPPGGEEEESGVGVYFRVGAVVLLAVVGVLWWRW